MHPMFNSIWFWLQLVVIIVILAISYVEKERAGCEYKIVASIVSVSYRKTTARLTDNSEVDLYRPTVKPGDSICVFKDGTSYVVRCNSYLVK